MAKQIIHGIGKAVLRDYKNPKKFIGFADLQDLTVESSSTSEDIVGGNKMFPIASFKTDGSLSVSGTNATFDDGMMEYLEGAEKTVGVNVMTGFMEVVIPAELEITLPKTPIANSVVVKDFESSETTASAGTYKATADKLTFHTDDVGTKVHIIYEYSSSAQGVEYAVKQASLAKPFVFEYIFPIYDEDSQVSHEGMIKIYKAKSTSGFNISPTHKGAFAPQFEATAQDPSRADGKLWTLLIDGVTVV